MLSLCACNRSPLDHLFSFKDLIVVGNAKFGDGTGHGLRGDSRRPRRRSTRPHAARVGVSRVFWNAQVHEVPEADYFAVAPNRRGMLPVRVPIRPIMPVIASIGWLATRSTSPLRSGTAPGASISLAMMGWQPRRADRGSAPRPARVTLPHRGRTGGRRDTRCRRTHHAGSARICHWRWLLAICVIVALAVRPATSTAYRQKMGAGGARPTLPEGLKRSEYREWVHRSGRVEIHAGFCGNRLFDTAGSPVRALTGRP
jgi:hypothetical protein